MKKLTALISTFLLLGIKPVSAAVQGPSFSLDGIFSLLQTVLMNVSSLFGMNWVRGNEVGFLKFLLWILVFTIFFFVGQIVFARIGGAAQGKKMSLIISLVLATSTALLVPGDLVVAMFSAYATVIIFVFMGAIIVGVVKLLYGDWLKNIVSGPSLHFVRILGLLLCWTILATITQFADGISGTTTFQFILPLIFIKNRKK